MSPPKEVELYCDLDAMDELKRQLQGIHAALDDVGDRVDVWDLRLGSGRLEQAIDDFISGWRDGRKQIRSGIEEAAGKVDGAVEAYQELEARLSAAAQGQPNS